MEESKPYKLLSIKQFLFMCVFLSPPITLFIAYLAMRKAPIPSLKIALKFLVFTVFWILWLLVLAQVPAFSNKTLFKLIYMAGLIPFANYFWKRLLEDLEALPEAKLFQHYPNDHLFLVGIVTFILTGILTFGILKGISYFSGARALYSCRTGDAAACKKLFSTKSRGKILQKMTASCKDSSDTHCYQLGSTLIDAKDYEAAFILLRHGCELGHMKSCAHAALTKLREKDFRVAIDYGKKSCEGDDAIGCYNLACAHCFVDEVNAAAAALNQAWVISKKDNSDLFTKGRYLTDPDLNCLHGHKTFTAIQKNTNP